MNFQLCTQCAHYSTGHNTACYYELKIKIEEAFTLKKGTKAIKMNDKVIE